MLVLVFALRIDNLFERVFGVLFAVLVDGLLVKTAYAVILDGTASSSRAFRGAELAHLNVIYLEQLCLLERYEFNRRQDFLGFFVAELVRVLAETVIHDF